MRFPLASTILLISLVAACSSAQTLRGVHTAQPFDDWFLVDLNGDGLKDLFLITRLIGGRLRVDVALQGKDDRFGPPQSGTLPGATAFVEGNFGKQQRVLAVFPHSFRSLRWSTSKGLGVADPIRPIESFLTATPTDLPGFWHWSTDFDGDGLDDFMFPGSRALEIRFGRPEGGFLPPKTLSLPGERQVLPSSDGGFVISHREPHPLFRDIDGDGRSDLCWFDEKGLGYRLQTRPREFAPAERLPLPWLAGKGDGNLLENTSIRLEDLNGDDRADLILIKMRSARGGIADMRSNLVILLSRGGSEPFPLKPTVALRLKGIVGVGPYFEDLNGDGRKDLAYGLYGAGLGDAVARFLGRVPVRLAVHLAHKDTPRLFDGAPDLSLERSVDTKDFERWAARNSLFIGDDLTGDGVVDLVEIRPSSKTGHRWKLYPGSLAPKGRLSISKKASKSGEIIGLADASVRALREGGPQRLILVGKQDVQIIVCSP